MNGGAATLVLERIGAGVLAIAREAGGIGVLCGRVVRSLVPPALDARELKLHLYKMGVRSVPIVVLTAFFTGGIMLIQSGIFVRRFGAYGLLGWGVGYAVFREIGPILIALMFSGRVGANNTAELGTMTVTEQIDGLRALAIDPIRYLLVPRVLAMMIMLFCLTLIGDLVAILGGAIMGKLLLGVDFWTFYNSFADNLKTQDLAHGLWKSIAFGGIIALSSCHFGVSVRGGAVGVGRAVNAAVVAAAVGIMLLDYFLTYLLP
ncbi:MAG TPA: ABC transporter permease [Polyangia bacterium]|nr:ABC transporter permease [Polyangia bacterium]